ncbi:hypothetical protein SAY86_021199 [Trapa natans]|uniref:Uncharacterized protein n=1 Tax=Trapa natans TaxID=22666 RepID=A0AAN7M9J6_TRANT|nr:hypothetical protein SAY86_021199 [Trapa natans]
MASSGYNHKASANQHLISGQIHHAPPLQHQQLQDGHQHQGLLQSSVSSSTITTSNNFIGKDAQGAYELGELDQSLFLYFDGQEMPSEQRQGGEMKPPTLNIFPSQPMHVEPSNNNKGSVGGLLVVNSPSINNSKRPREPSMQLGNTGNEATPSYPRPAKMMKKEGSSKGTASSSQQDGNKIPNPKTLRRLAQNREAARKSRLRKKAYIQQLESSRIKLTQLEQELQRVRSQGLVIGGGSLMATEEGFPVGMGSISSDAAQFDINYTRWLEDHRCLMWELRAAARNDHFPENELRLLVDSCLAHYDVMINLKSEVAKSDVVHLFSGMWKTPAERCFMWVGGFRPSELIKVILSQIEPLTQQQIIGLCGLQQSMQQAEEALSQELEVMYRSVSEAITSDWLSSPPIPNMASSYMGQMMVVAMNKLSTLEGFLRQADGLRQQTIHRLPQILTTRQAAGCLIAISEYFNRLRTLSSLWITRPRHD